MSAKSPEVANTARTCSQREFFNDNLLIRIHFIIVMIRWTGLAPWEFEFPVPGSLGLFKRFESKRLQSGAGSSKPNKA